MNPIGAWSDDVVAAFHNNTLSAITFFSEKTADETIRLIQQYSLEWQCKNLTALALSASIAERIQSISWKNISLASTVDEIEANLRKS